MADQLDRVTQDLADRYAIERELGRGAMATVYLAEDLKHRRKVAVKVLRPELAVALGPERFLREIAIAAALTHPHVVPVHDSGQAGGTLFYVMPYVEGDALRLRLERDQRIPLDEALQIAREVADALAYAHRNGVVHRDIKPANILIAQGHAVVADFGIAQAVSAAGSDRLTHPGLVTGTPAYMSPEQALGGSVDGRSDIYSLGRVLYEMLVGELATGPTPGHQARTGSFGSLPSAHQARLATVPRPVVQTLARSLAQDPNDRFQTAEEFAASLGRFVVAGPRRRKWPAVAVTVLLASVLAIVLFRSKGRTTLDPDVVAVAPFEVLDPALELWREGLADLLSASLDGAGPLRTVPASVVLRHWEGRGDPVSAAALGSRVGAGLVLYGSLVGAGPDSARAIGILRDVDRDRTVVEFDLRDGVDRIDRLADSLAMRIMDELSRARRFSGWRLASLGSSSPAALKAFLRGEQHFRRFTLDSAQWHFARAIELDSTFALAFSRRAVASGWSVTADPEYTPMLLRAGALNHGLGRRESLLLAADSIRGALGQFVGDSASWATLRRLLPTLQLAAAQYPSDPLVWFELGEARYHQGPYLGLGDQAALEAFARAVALDSTFVVPYRHLLELTLLLRGPDQARQVATQFATRTDSSVYRDAAAVTAALLDPVQAAAASTQAAIERLPREALFQTWYDVKWWVDSAETAVRVARTWAAAADSGGATLSLALSLAYRGHLREARGLAGDRQPAFFVVLALLGAVPRDSANGVMAGWLQQRSRFGIFNAHRWWAEEGDTASLRQAVAYWDSLGAAVRPQSQPVVRNAARSGRAYLALARGDTATALGLLETIAPWPQRFYSYYEQLTRAQVLARLRRDQDAADLLARLPFERQFVPSADAIVAELERGRVHERLGNRDAAVRAYSLVVAAWRNGDSVLQPAVAEARSALARLIAEPQR